MIYDQKLKMKVSLFACNLAKQFFGEVQGVVKPFTYRHCINVDRVSELKYNLYSLSISPRIDQQYTYVLHGRSTLRANPNCHLQFKFNIVYTEELRNILVAILNNCRIYQQKLFKCFTKC